MEHQQIFALIAFACVSAITPGPNNIMLMTSGANAGYVKTIPHMLGIMLGFSLMIVLVGLGLMKVFNLYPLTLELLKSACVAYLLYLAWKIARSEPATSAQMNYRPMSFFSAACFQWVNPKGWTMALTAISVYAGASGVSGVLLAALVFGVMVLPTASVWILVGTQLQKILTTKRSFRIFNVSMATLLLLSVLGSFL